MSNIAMILLPFLSLIGTMILLLILEAFDKSKNLAAPVTIVGGFISLMSVIFSVDEDVTYYLFGKSTAFLELSSLPDFPMMVIDNFFRFFAIIFLLVLVFVAIASMDYMKTDRNLGVYYSLLILATVGMLLIVAANDLLLIFVAWELGSIPVYSLAAYQKSRADTSESALKFFLIGAMSSAFILFGISLVYGIAGSTALDVVMTSFSDLSMFSPLHILALMFLFVGFGYKMAAVPFHAWAVDVYQGTPTTITSFLAAGSKAMGFAAVLRIIVSGLTELGDIWGTIFVLLAIVTMTLGNVVALVQNNIKRMLAYSSIAHAGYILIAFAAIASEPIAAISTSVETTVAEYAIASANFHILTHALMKIVAFTIVIVVFFSIRSENIEDYAGLRKRHPWIVFSMTIVLLSLMGVPPLAGFVSKLFIFFSAVYADLLVLALIGVINSAISVFYYIRVIKFMIMDPPQEELLDSYTVSVEQMKPYNIPLSYSLVIGLGIFLIILIGVMPETIFNFAVDAAEKMLGN